MSLGAAPSCGGCYFGANITTITSAPTSILTTGFTFGPSGIVNPSATTYIAFLAYSVTSETSRDQTCSTVYNPAVTLTSVIQIAVPSNVDVADYQVTAKGQFVSIVGLLSCIGGGELPVSMPSSILSFNPCSDCFVGAAVTTQLGLATESSLGPNGIITAAPITVFVFSAYSVESQTVQNSQCLWFHGTITTILPAVTISVPSTLSLADYKPSAESQFLSMVGLQNCVNNVTVATTIMADGNETITAPPLAGLTTQSLTPAHNTFPTLTYQVNKSSPTSAAVLPTSSVSKHISKHTGKILRPAAKLRIGLGISVTALALFVLVLGALLLRRYRRKRQLSLQSKVELDSSGERYEKEGASAWHELHGDERRVELQGEGRRQELRGKKHAQELS